MYKFQCKECGHIWAQELPEDNHKRPIMPKCPKCGGKSVILDYLGEVFSVSHKRV